MKGVGGRLFKRVGRRRLQRLVTQRPVDWTETHSVSAFGVGGWSGWRLRQQCYTYSSFYYKMEKWKIFSAPPPPPHVSSFQQSPKRLGSTPSLERTGARQGRVGTPLTPLQARSPTARLRKSCCMLPVSKHDTTFSCESAQDAHIRPEIDLGKTKIYSNASHVVTQKAVNEAARAGNDKFEQKVDLHSTTQNRTLCHGECERIAYGHAIAVFCRRGYCFDRARKQRLLP